MTLENSTRQSPENEAELKLEAEAATEDQLDIVIAILELQQRVMKLENIILSKIP